MEFKWDLIEPDFSMYKENQCTHDANSGNKEYLGSVRIGNLCFDIINYGNHLWFDLYVGGVDTGYGYGADKYPYDYCDAISFPWYEDLTIMTDNEFKERVEKFIEARLNSREEYLVDIKDVKVISVNLLKKASEEPKEWHPARTKEAKTEAFVAKLKEVECDYKHKYIACIRHSEFGIFNNIRNICYTGNCFVFTTGSFIGKTPADVVHALSQGNMSDREDFLLREAPGRTLIITDDMSADDVIEWFFNHKRCGTVYTKNPEAEILIMSQEPKILLDVYFDERCTYQDKRNISVDEFCEIIGRA